MPDTSFPSLKIVNHHGEFKTTYQHVKAVALKELLEKNLTTSAKPREMFSFYFVCKAMDGYSVVYSYNELFKDSPEIFIVIAFDNFTTSNMPGKPMLFNYDCCSNL